MRVYLSNKQPRWELIYGGAQIANARYRIGIFVVGELDARFTRSRYRHSSEPASMLKKSTRLISSLGAILKQYFAAAVVNFALQSAEPELRWTRRFSEIRSVSHI